MGLKHWWPLNGSLEDYVGKNNLVASGAFNSNDNGKIGKCYNASATSAYAQSTTAIYLEGNLSLCFWFKVTAYSDSPTALITLHEHGSTSNMGLNLAGDKLTMSIGYTDGTREWNGKNSTTTISLNTWYHGALTFDRTSNRVSLYVNGVREYTGTLSKTVKFTARKLSVNRWSTEYSGYATTGFYNDIRLYDHELSYKEVKEIAKAKMIHYTCNVSANSKVRDSSGFRYHASLASGASPTLTSADSGVGSSSFLFENGSKQSNGLYQHFISDTTIRIPDQGTLSYWIKYSGTENGDNKYAVGFANFCSINNSGALGMIYYKDASNYTTTTANQSLRDSKWHMHTISWDKSTKAFKNYLDGTLLQSATVTDFTHAGTFRQFIVGSAWTTSYGGHSGYLDDIRVYATVLSDTDVKDLYQTKGSVSKNGKLFVNEIIENTNGKLTYDEVSVSGLSNVTMTKAKSTTMPNGAIVSNTATTAGQFRISLPKAKLTASTNMVFSFNYRFIKGSTLTPTDWCDGSITIKNSNGCMQCQGTRSSYDDTYRFIDFNISADTSIEMWNFKLYAGTVANCKTNVTKKGILYTEEIIEVESCSMKTKTELDANWVRLFYHNSSAGTVLFSTNKNEFLRCNTGNKISDLWALEQFRGKDGKFELLLQYQNSTGYNRWKQSSNFTKETTISGYEAVAVSWTSQSWGGLALSSTPANTWVDGSPGASTWYYAIGPVVAYQGGMPNQSAVETGWVEIWVRCDDINLFRMIKNGKCKATEFIEI